MYASSGFNNYIPITLSLGLTKNELQILSS